MPSTGNLGVDSDAATWKSPAYGAGLGNHLPIGYWGSVQYRSAIRFLQPAGWTGWTDIASATLTIYTSDFQHVGVRNSQIYCRRVANSAMWTRGAGSTSCESGFSAANSTQYTDIGPVATDQIQFSSGTTASKAITLDVTAMVKYYWQNNASRIVFVFDPVGSSDYTELWSTEHSSPNITLAISYLVQSPPVAPALTAPAAGSAQATQTPTFSWNHSDPQGDPQASAQVRVWDATGTTQVGTTQTVTGTAGSLVWPTALPRGVSYMWDVATADAANGYGPFSAKQAFSVKPNPTVTIDATRYMSYSGGAPRLTVKWTVTNGTQYKYRVTAPGYDSGLLTSTATSHLLSTLGLTNGTAVPITVYVETSDPLNGSQTVSFTPRWGQTVHRRDLTAAPTGWGTPTVVQTVPSGAALIIEYGSSATATAAPSPNTWYSTLSGVPKARYVFYRATFIPSATAGPTLDKIVIPSSASVQVVDQWAANLGGPFILNAAGGYDIDTGEYVYGSRSLHCTVPGAGPYTMFSAPIQVRAGRSYILTGLMKSVGNSGAQFRLADSTGATLTNPDGTPIASIISKGPPLVQAILGDAEWFTPDQRDVNRYATPVWVSPSDQTVYVVLRAGNTAGAQCWWDGIKLEESSVATPWAPAAVGATIIDAGGVQVDGSLGGILRYRGTAGGLRDVVAGGPHGLLFGGDSEISSPVAGRGIRVDTALEVAGGSYSAWRFLNSGAVRGMMDYGTSGTDDVRLLTATGAAGAEAYQERTRWRASDGMLIAAGGLQIGGSRPTAVIYEFSGSIVTGTGTLILTPVNVNAAFPMMYNGRCVGISMSVVNARTAGTATAQWRINNTTRGTPIAQLDATNTARHQNTISYAAAAGGATGVGSFMNVIVTTTGFTPLTNPIVVHVLVVYEDIGA